MTPTTNQERDEAMRETGAMTEDEKLEALAEVLLTAGLSHNPLFQPPFKRVPPGEMEALRRVSRDTRMATAKAILDEIAAW